MNKKITITDVASMAGVSKGTVDRVIHNRGEVSPKSFKKVMEVIGRLDYKPNVYASLLASNRRYRFACLIPAFSPGEFWEIVNNGIHHAYEQHRDLNIVTETVYYDQFDAADFDRGCQRILSDLPDAVMIAPMFRERAKTFTDELAGLSIPFVFIESKIDDTPYTAYFGMPAFESGFLSARLLIKGHDAHEVACFRVRRGGDALSNTASGRLDGFQEYMRTNAPQCRLHLEYMQPYECAENTETFDRFFTANPGVRHIVTFNSRAFIICDYLRERGMSGCTVLGFDPLEHNVRCMKEGYLEYIIAQKGMTQAYESIKALCDLFVLKKTPAVRNNYMSMDILTAENVDYYTDLR